MFGARALLFKKFRYFCRKKNSPEKSLRLVFFFSETKCKPAKKIQENALLQVMVLIYSPATYLYLGCIYVKTGKMLVYMP